MSEFIEQQGEDPNSRARTEALAKMAHIMSQSAEKPLSETIIESEKPSEADDFYSNNTLPTRFAPESYDMRRCLELYGVEFGDPIHGNEDFTEAILPDGWSKVQHKHPMWVRILDDRGIERGLIFWKRGLNGNPPEINTIVPRYRMFLEDAQEDELIGASIAEDGVTVHQTELHSVSLTEEMKEDAIRFAKSGYPISKEESIASAERLRQSYIRRVAEAEALEWVEENHPEWADIVENFPVRSRKEEIKYQQYVKERDQ